MPWVNPRRGLIRSVGNEDVADQLSEIAALLKLRGDDTFRVRAYERAASAVLTAPVDLASLDVDALADVKGIGASTARKVVEHRETGTMALLEELREAVPPGVVALVRVPGLGPKTARLLHERLGLASVEQLRAAIDAGQLEGLPGLGAKTAANLRDSLARMGTKDTDRMPAADALGVAVGLVDHLRTVPGVLDVAYAGSLRRMRETIGDVDVVAASDDPGPVMAALRDSPQVQAVLAAGEKKTSVVLRRGVQADLRVVGPESWGAALVYFTGSKAHNVRIRERAVRAGLTVNEYGVWRDGDRVAGATEDEVYAALDLQPVPAPLREDTGEVEAAAAGRLPQVVTLPDLRGDLHGHSDWSGDGTASLEQMLSAATARGWSYWAVTDHAEDLTVNGVSRADILARRRAIAELQERHDVRVLDGVELNIDADGGLDYDDDFLLAFDFCVASVHSLLQRDEAAQTARIVAAMEHPAVNVIGHPTGRKIGVRPGYPVDFDALVEAAVRTGTALEVNASPRRLDLSGEMVRRAVDAGAALTISCDAHSVRDLDSMAYGVATAQRGWATPADVLNCRDLDGLLAFVNAKRPDRHAVT